MTQQERINLRNLMILAAQAYNAQAATIQHTAPLDCIKLSGKAMGLLDAAELVEQFGRGPANSNEVAS